MAQSTKSVLKPASLLPPAAPSLHFEGQVCGCRASPKYITTNTILHVIVACLLVSWMQFVQKVSPVQSSPLITDSRLQNMEFHPYTDVVSYINCHNTRELDDSVACGLLEVHTRGFVLIGHSGFAPVPYQMNSCIPRRPCAAIIKHLILCLNTLATFHLIWCLVL